MFEFHVVPGHAVAGILAARPEQVGRLVRDTYLRHEHGLTTNPASLFLRPAEPPNSRAIALPAHLGGDRPVMGMKWISSFPANVRAGLPRASAVLILNDPTTGYPVACLEAAGISAARTAASAALAATTLAPGPVRTVGFVGAGVIARTIADHLRHAGVECAEVCCHDLDAASATALSEHLRDTWTAPAVRVTDLGDAVGCDLVVFATTAAVPYVPASIELRAGQLVLHVSLRDLDPAHLLASNNIVDDVDHCLTAATSAQLAERTSGSRAFVTGTIGAVLLGAVEAARAHPGQRVPRPGRRDRRGATQRPLPQAGPGGVAMRVAVTGASGFVGGAVCRAAADAGWTVHAFGRRTVHVAGAAYRSWDLAEAPLPSPPTVDAVVHCAGSVTDWAPRHEQWAANVTGTQHVLDSFPTARLVHVSTASVYDPYRPTVAATEDQAPVTRYQNTYGESKAAAERLVRPAAIILRPHAVYGPGDTTLLPRVLQAVRGSRLIAVGDGTQRISLTSIANLTQACLLAARSDATGVFNIADAEPVLLRDALTSILAERAIPARVQFVPLRVALPVAWLAETSRRLLRRRTPPRLTRYAVSHLAHERTLDITAARTVLGYDPAPTSFAGAGAW